MGSYDGAESCELVRAYLQYLIKERFRDTCDFALYRDDGLGVSKVTARQTDLIKKKLCTIFKKNCLRITIEVNKPTVNFLDVTLDLKNGTHRPFSKPGNIPLYVNSKSNHPPRILQNIPKSINKRLFEISFDKESFEQAAPLYQHALYISGYNHTLSFSSQSARPSYSRKNRLSNFIWCNPPFRRNVATNVGRTFFKILDFEFPTHHILHKIFNRSIVKISYSCMPKSQVENQRTQQVNPTVHE